MVWSGFGVCAVGELLREVEDEVTRLLCDLIRFDTTNPPGNETAAAEYLARVLGEEGFECEVLESAPGRGSMVTRLKGSGPGPSLLFLSHLDVVAADPREWSVPPFDGVVKDGFVWGRGALDMKSLTAIQVVVLKLLKRNGVRLRGDVVLAATADEEKGGEAGAGWLVKNHPRKVCADYVITEFGGPAMPIGEKNLFSVQTAEKGILWLRIRARGSSGHGSKPGSADNAIMRMNKVIERLGNYRDKVVLVPTVKQYLAALARENVLVSGFLTRLLEEPASADEVLDELSIVDGFLAEDIRAMVRMTVAPTMLHGGTKENVIPSECEAVFDCRVLPGQSADGALKLIKRLLADMGLDRFEFEIIHAAEPSESKLDTLLFRHITEVLREFDSGYSVAPFLLTGSTDSRFFRRRGSVCYGFQPFLADMNYGEMWRTLHGVDERISVKNLVFGTSVLYNVVERFMGTGVKL
jgi:acetylornithine deacetylase/succinyl-diaminopimelate desuccinylase-like protein